MPLAKMFSTEDVTLHRHANHCELIGELSYIQWQTEVTLTNQIITKILRINTLASIQNHKEGSNVFVMTS